MSYGYTDIFEQAKTPVFAQTTEVQAAPTLVAAPAQFSEEQIETLKQAATELPEEVQTALLSAAAEKRTTLGRALTTQEAAETIHATLLEQGKDPLSLNAMTATPTGQEMANAAALQQQAQEAGRSTISEADIERLTQRAEAIAARGIAQGASDDTIRREVAKLPGYSTETAAVVNAKVEQQLDTDKFNLLSNRNAPEGASVGAPVVSLAAATPETAAPENPLLATALGVQEQRREVADDELRRRAQLHPAVGIVPVTPVVDLPAPAAAVSAPERPYGVTCGPFACQDMGPTTAALAALGQFTPQPDLPNLNIGRGQSVGAQLG